MLSPRLQELVKRGLYELGWELKRVRPEAASSAPRYSTFREQEIAEELLRKLPVRDEFCVDIGAGDGETMSNSLFLFRSGWRGVAVEAAPRPFAGLAYRYSRYPEVALARCRVTPKNLVPLLEANGVPRQFGFLTLDIDSYDYFALEAILAAYRPMLVCTEINEKIPPPIRFAVKWDPELRLDHGIFYGQSIAMLSGLAARHDYALVTLEYNNAFLVPRAVAPLPALSAEEAYERGYRARGDRLDRLPWNRELEPLQRMPPAEAVAFLRRLFAPYEGKFICEL